MPLADHPGMITGFLKHFGDRWLAAIKPIENGDAINVAVFSGEDRGAAGCTDGVDGEAIQEAHPFIGDAVDVRGLIEFAAVTTHGVSGVIVGHNEQYVRPGIALSLGGSRRHASHSREDQGKPEAENIKTGAHDSNLFKISWARSS
jgi:hypothetical protein